MSLSILITSINNSLFGFPTQNCKGVQSFVETRKLPFTKEHIMGIANFRGDVNAVIDVMVLLKGTKTIGSDKNPIIRLREKDNYIAVLVNQVIDFIDIPKERLSDSKKFLDPKEAKYISHIVENDLGLIRIFHVDKLINV